MKKKYSVGKKLTPRRPSSKVVLLSLAVLVVVGFVATFFVLRATDKQGTRETVSQTPSNDSINYSPPTEEERSAANTQKDETVKQQESQPTSPTTPGAKMAVKPVIVSAANNTLRAFVAGVTENNGTCTARFTNSAQTVTKTSAAFADAQSTVCTPINYQDSGIAAGWSVTVTYQSTTSEGSSDAATVQ